MQWPSNCFWAPAQETLLATTSALEDQIRRQLQVHTDVLPLEVFSLRESGTGCWSLPNKVSQQQQILNVQGALPHEGLRGGENSCRTPYCQIPLNRDIPLFCVLPWP